jgi:hypothetical protein
MVDVETRNGVMRYKPNNSTLDGLGGFMKSPIMKAVALAAGEAVAMEAREIVVSENIIDTGAYLGAFKVRSEEVIIKGNARASARVENDDRAAAPIEFGNAHTPIARHVMLRAAKRVAEKPGYNLGRGKEKL